MLGKLLIAAFATWRWTLLVVYGHEFKWLRNKAWGLEEDEDGLPLSYWGRQIICPWCMSLWLGTIATILAFTSAWWVLVPFALSGGAIYLNHNTRIFRDAGDKHG